MSSLPGYTTSIHTGNSHKVWYRNYLAWDIQCEWDNGKDRASVLDDIDAVRSAANRLLALMILTIIHIIVVKIIILAVIFVFKCQRKEKEYRQTSIIGKSINTFFNVLLIIFLIVLRVAIH